MFIKKSETINLIFYGYLIRKYHKLSGYSKPKFVDEIKKNQSGDSIAKEKGC